MNEIDDILMEMSPDPMNPLNTADFLYQFHLAMNAFKKAISREMYNMRKLHINIQRRRINNNHRKIHGVAMYRRRAYLKALKNERR